MSEIGAANNLPNDLSKIGGNAFEVPSASAQHGAEAACTPAQGIPSAAMFCTIFGLRMLEQWVLLPRFYLPSTELRLLDAFFHLQLLHLFLRHL